MLAAIYTSNVFCCLCGYWSYPAVNQSLNKIFCRHIFLVASHITRISLHCNEKSGHKKETGKSWLLAIDFVWQPPHNLGSVGDVTFLDRVKSINLENVLDSYFKSSVSRDNTVFDTILDVYSCQEAYAPDVLTMTIESGDISDVTCRSSCPVEMI